MAAVKRVPLRQCVGCGERKGKKELLRIVRPDEKSAGQGISFDFTGKKNGRGAYICNNAACLELARKKKSLERSLKAEIDQSVYEALKKELEQIETG